MNAGYLEPEPYAGKLASTVLLSSGGESPLILEKGPEMVPTYPTPVKPRLPSPAHPSPGQLAATCLAAVTPQMKLVGSPFRAHQAISRARRLPAAFPRLKKGN